MGELNLDELERLATFVAQHEWVDREWAEAAFGSPAEAKYVAALDGKTVLVMIARIRDLEQDAARLDWLAHHGASLRKDHDGARLWYLVVPYHTGTPVDDYPRHPTPRAAIDAARKEKGHG